ncbi:MAG: peptidyl-tRNA hydrolase Pth2 [Thermoplasmata archaeon]
MMEYKLAVVVREDLGLSAGKVAAQVGHASVACALKAQKGKRAWFRAWMDEGQRKVVLRIDGRGALLDLQQEGRALGLTTALITDAGLTEVPPGTQTCLGLGPGPENVVDRVTGQLRLL